MALYGYAMVIYCDFSGYSDVAIGIALWLGFKIPPNFLSPYSSKSVTEFWKKLAYFTFLLVEGLFVYTLLVGIGKGLGHHISSQDYFWWEVS